jgi:hypothetical protein
VNNWAVDELTSAGSRRTTTANTAAAPYAATASCTVGFEVLTAVSMKIAVAIAIALMMEAARTSETLVNFYQTTRCYNPEDSNLHAQCSSLSFKCCFGGQ